MNTELRKKLRRITDILWAGGVTNPVTYIEQISYLIYLKLLDEEESSRELKARLLGDKPNANGALLFSKQAARYRWSKWRFKSGKELRDFVRDQVFPYMGNLVKEEPQIAEYFRDAVLEIVDPNTLKAVPEGEIGEMVVTTLRKEAVPLIRYRTRDLTRLVPGDCPCGSILPRHDRLLGRSDDMIIFRAVNIYPGQIDHVLSGIQGIGSEYQIILDRRQDGRDYMTLRVERDQGTSAEQASDLGKKIGGEVKKQIMVSAEIDVVEYGSLPRSERKSKRVFDNRDNNEGDGR